MENKSYTYSSHIDLKEEIRKIFKYLRDSGEFPYAAPHVVICKSDASNAQTIAMKTAYYNPDNSTIYLYVDGRHPRDIINSVMHEYVHHIQNHEGRLDNIQTDNVHEDDRLEELEREAYEMGGILFRKYKDSQKKQHLQESYESYFLNELFEKDLPNIKKIFPTRYIVNNSKRLPITPTPELYKIDENIKEISQDTPIEKKQYTIYIDLDDVLAGFEQGFKDRFGMYPSSFKQKFDGNEMSKRIDNAGEQFWIDMPWEKGGKYLWDYIKKYNPTILTDYNEISKIGKKKWIEQNIGKSQKVIFSHAKDKAKYSKKDSILIDNKLDTIYDWIAKGGIGIHYLNIDDIINKLKKIGL